jgi:hypothetical protein
MKRRGLVIACALGLAVPAGAQTLDISGRWDLTVQTPDGPRPTPLALKKDGAKIVGTIQSPRGEVPVEATLKENAVAITFTYQTNDGPLPVTMNGTVEGDSMKGTMDLGPRGQMTWSAVRARAASDEAGTPAPVDVAGTWALEVTTSAGSGTPTMTFEQQGEKLTGRYSGLLGEAPITGTLKGTAIRFVIDASFDGAAVGIVYSGTVDKDSMKGTVSFGDLAEGTFTGKRKK